MTDEHLLFVTWDGPQVSYVESLFVPIFQRLGEHGVKVSILQFSWGDPSSTEAACRRAGIAYRRVEIVRKFGALGALASAIFGAFHVRRAIRDWSPTILMPRSLFAGLAVLACGARNVSILFDADGLPADERVEAGIIASSSAVYRTLTRIERALVRRSCHTIVRTEAATKILAGRAGVERSQFTVVTNGRDQSLFKSAGTNSRSRIRRELGVADNDILLVYAGSAGPQYLLGEVGRLIAAMRPQLPSLQLLVLSGECEAAQQALGLGAERTIFRTVKPSEVFLYLSAADAGLSLRSDSLAMQAVAPVKMGEYLLCGLPVIGTLGIGDTGPAEDADIMISADRPAIEIANWLLERSRDRRATARLAREVGENHFSLDRSVADYCRAIAACRT